MALAVDEAGTGNVNRPNIKHVDFSVPNRHVYLTCRYNQYIYTISHNLTAATADTALQLARYFGMSEAFWMGLQADDDLEEARNRPGKRLEIEVSTRAA
jgi:hypothetical protein